LRSAVTRRTIPAPATHPSGREPFAGRGVKRDMRSRQILAFTLAWLFAGPPVFSQDALALFHKMQDALGGAARIAAVQDFEEIVRAESWNGNTGTSMGEVTKRTRWIRPNHLRVDQVGPGSTYVLYFDGTRGWEIIPGSNKVVELEGGELEFARGYVRGFRLNTWLADRNPAFQITSPSPGVVRVSDGDVSHQLDLTIDPSSLLPVKEGSLTLSDPAHPMSSESVMTEWELVQGVRFPKRWTVYRSGRRVAEALEARHRVNVGLKLADLEAQPNDLKPVLPPR